VGRDSLLPRLADLAVTLGANVQPDQIVTIGADHGQFELARAIADSAYRRGARFVDVQYFDPYVKRARIQYAETDSLDFVPTWYSYRMRALGTERAARISLAGPTATGLLDDLDQTRSGRDQLPFVKEILDVISDRTTNWTVVPCPTVQWAQLVHPELPADEALDRLWEEVAHLCRLDEPDPVASWDDRAEALSVAAERLNQRHFDALHFEGPGTDLTIGLLPTSTFHAARDVTVDGIEHLANLPTEEVYATPDPERADGHVTSTKPLVLGDGTIIRGLRVRFEGGRAFEIDADQGGGVMRGRAAFDDGASRSARSPSSTERAGSASWARCSTTRCSTRTRPATSHSATAPTRDCRTRIASGGTAARSTSTSWSAATRSPSRGSHATVGACRSCARVPGSSRVS
jgi:aminopeptidase